jgi:hypothetical protein
MVAYAGNKELTDVREYTVAVLFDPASECTKRSVMLGLAGYLACVTADAFIEVYQHPVFFINTGHI